MSRQYPRYAGKVQLGEKERQRGVTCACCTQPAIGYADIQYSWSRDDDTAYPVCDEHRRLAREDVNAFIDSIGSQKGKDGGQ
jgi:hypothetical protein